MIPGFTSTEVLSALKEIDKNGVPSTRKSRKYDLVFKDKKYPPKYVVSLASDSSYKNFDSGDAIQRLEALGYSITQRKH